MVWVGFECVISVLIVLQKRQCYSDLPKFMTFSDETEADIGPTGCACALAKNGEILYEGYLGFADAGT